MDNKKAEAARTKQHAWTTKKQRQGRGERDSKLKRETQRIDAARTKQHAWTAKKQRQGKGAKRQQA
jgi:hypothetical protein